MENAQFPVKLEDIHGIPAHKLTISINKGFNVESFEIEDVKSDTKPKSTKFTQEVLKSIELNESEIQLYFMSSGKGPMSLGELAILSNRSIEQIKIIAEKFVQKGLFKVIPGSTAYFQALPPYAALMAQLDKFRNMIAAMKMSTPTDLQTSFMSFEESSKGSKTLSEFVDYLSQMKIDVSKQLSTQKTVLDNSLHNLMEQQKVIMGIKDLRDQSISLLDIHFVNLFNQFEIVSKKITTNLEKLHLGVVIKTVEDVVQKNIDNQMEIIRSELQAEFESKFRNIMDTLLEDITEITTNADSIGDKIHTSFDSIITQFDATLTQTQDRIVNISNTVNESFGDLRSTFSDEVVITLDDILGKIVKQLDLSTSTINEFWDESKRVVNFTMQDVWFIKTSEGMQAQINDAISRAKMRILIVAPTLSDIDIEPLKFARKHINIRICCSIYPDDPSHQQKMAFFDSVDNITYRDRKLQNLWGVSRDYEEIILSIIKISKGISGFNMEVAGIGSILTEHIKIFVPILEDAWMGAHKDIVKKEIQQRPIKKKEQPRLIAVEPKKKPSEPLKGGLGAEAISSLQKQVERQAKPVIDPFSPALKKDLPITPIPSREPPKVVEQKPIKTPPQVVQQPVTEKPPKKAPGNVQDILDKIENLSTILSFPKKLVSGLEDLRTLISKKLDIARTESDITNWIKDIQGKPIMDDFKKKILSKRLKIWKENVLEN
jgi:sugar-specific transcriptional regulator TrmB